MKNTYKTTKILSTLTPFLLCGVVILMGGGHGFYTPGIVIFPTSLISFSIFNQLEIPFVILGIIQYPLYGLIIDKSKNKPITSSIIAIFHIILVLVTFMTIRDL